MAFSVCELGLSPDAHWALSPQEWWPMWSFKYGARRDKINLGLTDDDISQMASDLRAQVKKEKEEGIR